MLNLSQLISFNSYLWLNGSIAIGYIVIRIIFGLSFFKKKTSQWQRLNCARYSFGAAITAFFVMPIIMHLFPFYIGE